MLTIKTIRFEDGVVKGQGTYNGTTCIFRNNFLLIGTFPHCDEKTISVAELNGAISAFNK